MKAPDSFSEALAALVILLLLAFVFTAMPSIPH